MTRLVTGQFVHGRFRHELPSRLADLLDDASRMLRDKGSEALNIARILSSPASDPVSGAVEHPNPDAGQLGHLVQTLERSWTDVLSLHAQMASLLAHSEDVPDFEDYGCVSCKRNAGHWEPAEPGYKSYCSWCRGWRKTYGDTPPIELLKAHHRGTRITLAMIEAARREDEEGVVRLGAESHFPDCTVARPHGNRADGPISHRTERTRDDD